MPPKARAWASSTAEAVGRPGFSPRFPWLGGDLQTLRYYFFPPSADLSAWPAQRLSFPLGGTGGDTLLATLHRPAHAAARPLVVLAHGLTGCEGSSYMLESARFFLTAGYPVMRLNLRGAGPSRDTCRGSYCAGSGGDIGAVLAALDAEDARRGVALVGFSLGGAIVLDYLARRMEAARPRGSGPGIDAGNAVGEGSANVHPRLLDDIDAGSAVGEGHLQAMARESGPGMDAGSARSGRAALPICAVTVSAPLDLGAAVRRMMRPRNVLYHRWLLARMKDAVSTGVVRASGRERAAVRDARSIREFDDAFTAPRNGFADADDYYARCSVRGVLDRVETPTLLLHARNDPWIPSAAYEEAGRNAQPHVTLTDDGGHVGFHGRGNPTPWYNTVIRAFLEQQAACP